MSLHERLQKIASTWEVLKTQDPTFQVIGSDIHHYNNRGVISQEELAAFEEQHTIQLPEEYKSYLLEVSNGGIGVEGRMFSLAESLSPLRIAPVDSLLDENHFSNPFILDEDKIIAYLTTRIKMANSEGNPIEMEYSDGGYLFLSAKSETEFYILVLNGACKQEVFELTKVEVAMENGGMDYFLEIRPVVRFKEEQISTLSFLDWIEDEQENWLNKNKLIERKLRGIKTMWYSFNLWDKNRQVLGAFMHKYELKPTLSEEEIKTFETAHSCILPDEYRCYLKLVSNGGVGPQYGMYRLSDGVSPLNSGSIDQGDFIRFIEQNPTHYATEFPITESEIESYMRNELANPNAPSKPIRLPKNAGGYIFLSEYGCGGYFIMPVNGIVAGQVWFLQKMDANKLTYELTDENGNVIQSGSYGDDSEGDYFEVYPELKFKNNQAFTVTFLEWLRRQQIIWFDDLKKDQPVVGDVDLNNEHAYYPLATGNSWTYKYGASEMTSHIESSNDTGIFVIANTASPVKSSMQKMNGEYFSDSFEPGNMQMILKDHLKVGDTWEVKCKMNGIDCVYDYKVIELFPTFTVENVEYTDVVHIECSSNMIMNGSRISMNSFIHTYYAKGVGAIQINTSGAVGSTATSLLHFSLKS